MNRLNHIVLFSFIYSGAVIACDAAVQTTSQTEPASVNMKTMVLKEQTESILLGFDKLRDATVEGDQQLSLEQLTRLRISIEELNSSTPYPSAPQSQPSANASIRQATSRPSGPIKASDEPPTKSELAEMERAVGLTHLPGPPLDSAEENNSAKSLPIKVFQATTDALALLDRAELLIRNQQIDGAFAAQNQARQIIAKLDADIP